MLPETQSIIPLAAGRLRSSKFRTAYIQRPEDCLRRRTVAFRAVHTFRNTLPATPIVG